jgi:threonine synthase
MPVNRRSPDIGAVEAELTPAPVVEVAGAAGPLSVLELFHGPTAAFKDFGARFLAASLERIPRNDPRRLTILVATSGDTGGAVAAAFFVITARRWRAVPQ